MLKEALQYILDGMRPETQDLCGRAYVITPSGAQEVIETPIVPATLQLHSLDSIVKMIPRALCQHPFAHQCDLLLSA